MPESNLREPTLLQERLFKELQNPKNKTHRQAQIAAGFSPNTPTKQIMKQLALTTLRESLETLGVTPDRMAARIADGQDALKLHVGADGGEHWAPDWAARYRYDTLVLRMFGVPVTGTIPESETPQVQMNVFTQVFNMMEASIQAKREVQLVSAVEIE